MPLFGRSSFIGIYSTDENAGVKPNQGSRSHMGRMAIEVGFSSSLKVSGCPVLPMIFGCDSHNKHFSASILVLTLSVSLSSLDRCLS